MENKLYCCYSVPLRDFLSNKGIRYLIAACNPNSGNLFFAYERGEKLDEARLDKKQMQFLYKDGSTYVFMDNETYEQVELDESKLEWEKKFLREEQLVEITYYNEEILGISLPAKVTLRITKCEPGVRGDTARAAQKDAELETGLTIRVPLFIEEGEEVIVRTDTGDYDSRA